MLEVELDYTSHDYNSYDLFYKCYPEDKILITRLQESVDNTIPAKNLFSFFDIGFSHEEVDIFSDFETEIFDCLMLDESLYDLQNKTESFLEKFSYGDSKDKNISVKDGAKLIAKLTSSVIVTSEYDSALVTIRALPKDSTEDIYA